MPTIEYLYDFASPNAFLVHRVLPRIAANHWATVSYVPVLLGGLFKATNNQSPMAAFANVQGKLNYQGLEMRRFCQRHGVEFTMNPAFPINTLPLMRAATFARGKPWEGDYIEAVFSAMWEDEQNMGDPKTIQKVLNDAGLPAKDIIEATGLPDVKGKLIAETEAAVERGVFGAPTMFLGDEMFFGKDSLDDLDWRLSQMTKADQS